MQRVRAWGTEATAFAAVAALLAVLLLAYCDDRQPAPPAGPDRPAAAALEIELPPVPSAARRLVASAQPDESPAVRPRTERAFLAQLVTPRQGAPASREALLAILEGEGPLAERVAALRAWFELALEPRYAPFATALTGDSRDLQQFAFRFLQKQAMRDADARRVLAETLAYHPGEARERSWAALPVVLHGDDAEVRHVLDLLASERDPAVLTGVAYALRGRRDHWASFEADRLELRAADLKALQQPLPEPPSPQRAALLESLTRTVPDTLSGK